MIAVTQLAHLESQLAAAYDEQSRLYGLALDVLARPAADRSTEERAQRLSEVMRKVAAVDLRLAPLKQQWDASRGRPGWQLRAALDRVQQRLQALIAATDQAEQSARADRDQLGTTADAAVQGRRMRQAYAAFNDK